MSAPDPDDIKTIQLDESEVLDDEEVADLKGVKLNSAHYDEDRVYGDESVRLLKPNGEPLAVFLKDVIDEDAMADAYKALRPVAVSGGQAKGNRFTAAGYTKGEASRDVLEDGSVSDTRSIPSEISPNTGIAGNFDRYSRIPYCRQTSYNVNNPDKFADAVPMFQRCDELFERYLPIRYQNQKAKADETVDEWLIPSTSFTTCTVNLNWQTATHTDSGDLPDGFGVMSVFSHGDYDGAFYIQPKYKTAFDIRTGDLILSDVHEWHGNGPFHSVNGYYERLSVVMYYRRQMDECGTPQQEVERAKRVADPEDELSPDDVDVDELPDIGYAQQGDDGGHDNFDVIPPEEQNTDKPGTDS